MRLLAFFVAALSAAVSLEAQTPAPGTTAAAPAAPVAQVAQGTVTVCGQAVAPPSNVPPAGSGPVIFRIVLCFEKQGGYPMVEANTYLYYIQLRPSVSGKWIPYDDAAEQTIREDFKRLWATTFLDDLAIRVEDYRFPNGVIGKMVVYDMEERERVKIVDYEGLGKVDQSKIEEALKEKSITIRLDSFIDPGKIRSVVGVVRELYAAEGYQFVEIRPEIKPVEGGPKLVHVTFHVTEGPKVKIREVDFVGNSAVTDGSLNRKMKENKEKGFLGLITGGGTYKEDKFAEDAQLVTDYYRDEGYIMAQIGQPQLKTLEDSEDGKTRWIQLQIPVTEGKKVLGRRVHVRRQHRRQLGSAAAAVQDREGRDLQPEEDQEGAREGARGLRLRRLFRVHRLPRPQAARPAGRRRRRWIPPGRRLLRVRPRRWPRPTARMGRRSST